MDDEEGNILPAVPPAGELRTGGEVSVCHDQQSDTPVHDAQQYEGLSVCAFISCDVPPHDDKKDATDSGSISSFSSFEGTEYSCFMRISD